MRRALDCSPVLNRRSALFLGAGALLCGCGPQHALPEPNAAQVNAAQRTIAGAGSLRRTERSPQEMAEMLRRVSLRLAQANDPLCRDYNGQGCRFRIGLTRDEEPNAFATEGNVVGVTAGMLEIVRNDAELAAVVAHEFGHHLANHLQRAGTRTQLGGLAGALLGAYLGGSGLAQTGAQLGSGAARLVYSQDEEREADYLAAFMVARAGYDLDQAGQIWVRLGQAAGGAEQPGLLRTHPTGPERLAAWQRTVAEIEAAGPRAAPRRT